jgi:hypothetical protein
VSVGRIGRTSMRNNASSVARAIPGLAHMRSNMASWRNRPDMDGAPMLSVAPLPHSERTARPMSCMRAICSTDSMYFSISDISSPCSASSARLRASTSAGSRSISSHPVAVNANEPWRINARVRSGRVAAKTMAAGPPSPRPQRTAFRKPTASMTAWISPARSSSVRTFGTGSDSPTPALSNTTTRHKVESWSKTALNSGMARNSSTWLTNGAAQTSSTGPSPNT